MTKIRVKCPKYVCFFFSVKNNCPLFTEKRKLGRFAAEDPEILEALGKKRRKSAVKSFDEDDDEFSPTVKEKVRREREKRKEAAKRVQEGDYLSNLNERTKAFNSRKDLLINKMKDSDEVLL